MDSLKKLGAKIIYYRKLKGMSQQELAGEIGVTRQYLSKMEHGKCSCNLEIIYKVAKALDVTPSDLLSK